MYYTLIPVVTQSGLDGLHWRVIVGKKTLHVPVVLLATQFLVLLFVGGRTSVLAPAGRVLSLWQNYLKHNWFM